VGAAGLLAPPLPSPLQMMSLTYCPPSCPQEWAHRHSSKCPCTLRTALSCRCDNSPGICCEWNPYNPQLLRRSLTMAYHVLLAALLGIKHTHQVEVALHAQHTTSVWHHDGQVALHSPHSLIHTDVRSLTYSPQPRPCRITGVQPAAGTACCRPDLPSTCQGAQISLNGSIVKSPPPPGSSPTDYSGLPVFHGSYPPVQVRPGFRAGQETPSTLRHHTPSDNTNLETPHTPRHHKPCPCNSRLACGEPTH
jgi:hypothetical protein